MILVFDTETTGLVRHNLPASDPKQPMIVQLAAILYDNDANELHIMNTLVKTDGWDIPQVVVNVHGITKARADAEGIPLAEVIDLFNLMVARAKLVVAHNIKFDSGVLQCAYAKLGRLAPKGFPPGFCTMESSTQLCKLPGRGKYKWPKLSEAYKFLFKEELPQAHDALADVRATARIYFAIRL